MNDDDFDKKIAENMERVKEAMEKSKREAKTIKLLAFIVLLLAFAGIILKGVFPYTFTVQGIIVLYLALRVRKIGKELGQHRKEMGLEYESRET